MASATIDAKTGAVKLELTLHEAAGLEALLSRVGDETGQAVNDATGGVFMELNALRDSTMRHRVMARFWPHEFDGFRKNRRALR